MSIERRKLTLAERLVMKSLRALTTATEGYWVTFDEEMLRSWGISGYLKSFVVLYKYWGAIEKHFGPETAHLLAFYSSLWNGCMYCGFGHLYGHNLYFFERTGALFPLSEDEVINRMRTTDEEIMGWVNDRLTTPELLEKRKLIQQLYAVRMGQPSGADPKDEEFLRMSIPLYAFINECSITSEPPAPAMGRFAKRKELIERYHKARAEAAELKN